MAEIELSVFSNQCLNRRISDEVVLKREVSALEHERNQAASVIDWRFSTQDARTKLQHTYPSYSDGNGTSVVGIDLPLDEGVHTLSGAPEFGGELQVTVSYQQINVVPTPTGTPGGQFKGIFQGMDNDAEIILRINWEIGKSSDMVGDYQVRLVVEFGENEDSSESAEVQLSILPGKCGDYNLDHTVNTRDVVIYLQVAASSIEPDAALLATTDTDGDGVITMSDALAVIEHTAGVQTLVGCASLN